MIAVDTLLSTIILAAVLVLRVLILHVFNMSSQKGFKKGKIILSNGSMLLYLSVIHSIHSHGSYFPSIIYCGTRYGILRPLSAWF